MSEKLSWDYDNQSGEQRATYKGLVIRAIRNESPSNPFTEWDGHWPMLANPLGWHEKITEYAEHKGHGLQSVLDRFTDAQIIHDQIHIAKIFNSTVQRLMEENDTADNCGVEPCKYCHDANALRGSFAVAMEDVRDSDKFSTYAELHKLLGYPVLNTTVRGYCQGDQTELLIVATPEAQQAHGWGPDRTPEDYQKDLEVQANLYKAWAFGDVYGYQLARRTTVTACTECFHDVDPGTDMSGCCGAEVYEEDAGLEDLDGDTSCWDYYGSDHSQSGLEEAAIDAANHWLATEGQRHEHA